MVTGWLMDGEEELRAGLSVGFNSMCWGLAQWPFLPAQKRISLCDSQFGCTAGHWLNVSPGARAGTQKGPPRCEQMARNPAVLWRVRGRTTS